jgi:MFS family permease
MATIYGLFYRNVYLLLLTRCSLVHPGFIKALHKPPKTITGLITSIYYVGTWVSYLFISHPLADRFGRRVAAASGVFITGIGAAIQTGARMPSGLAMMISGRIICGVGLAIVSTSVPLYQRYVRASL